MPIGEHQAGGMAPSPAPSRFALALLALVGLVAVAVLVPQSDPALAAPGGMAWPPVPTAGAVRQAMLTAEGFDTYHWSARGPAVAVRAGVANRGTNLRMVWWPTSGRVSRDQETCITWTGMAAGDAATRVQPGVALRVRNTARGVAAITVTNNIWSGSRVGWNVHTWQTRPGQAPDYHLISQNRMLASFGDDPWGLPPLPWRMCARALGATVEYQVWSLGRGDHRPAWGASGHGGVVQLPPGWEVPGRAGWYVGHLGPRETIALGRPTTRSVRASGAGAGIGRLARATASDASLVAVRAGLRN